MCGSHVRRLFKTNPENLTVSANGRELLPIKTLEWGNTTPESAEMGTCGLRDRNLIPLPLLHSDNRLIVSWWCRPMAGRDRDLRNR
jgi:hypothetical protein